MIECSEREEVKAAEEVKALLQKPYMDDLMSSQADDMSYGDVFDPWSLFPCVYGSYSSDFDDMAISVLSEILARADDKRSIKAIIEAPLDVEHRNDLGAEMFREMLCKKGLCNYGTSPRMCFATEEFKPLLRELVERWTEYAKREWED